MVIYKVKYTKIIFQNFKRQFGINYVTLYTNNDN